MIWWRISHRAENIRKTEAAVTYMLAFGPFRPCCEEHWVIWNAGRRGSWHIKGQSTREFPKTGGGTKNNYTWSILGPSNISWEFFFKKWTAQNRRRKKETVSQSFEFKIRQFYLSVWALYLHKKIISELFLKKKTLTKRKLG